LEAFEKASRKSQKTKALHCFLCSFHKPVYIGHPEEPLFSKLFMALLFLRQSMSAAPFDHRKVRWKLRALEEPSPPMRKQLRCLEPPPTPVQLGKYLMSPPP
jgi:hypothetical protein